MNIVLLGQQSLFRFVGRMLSSVLPTPLPDAHRGKSHPISARVATKNVAVYAAPARTAHRIPSNSPIKPLRIVRLVESGQTRASVGRMVISGRMADVCAELDRLAACEAALT